MTTGKDNDTVFCRVCCAHVVPDYVSYSVIAMYGPVVYAKGLCPECDTVIVREHMIDDNGLIPPKRNW